MSLRAAYAARQLAAMLARRGGRITLRQLASVSGPNPAVNPPRGGALTLAVDHAAGDLRLQLAATPLLGRVVSGDAFQLGAQLLVATANAIAANNQVTVPIDIALSQDWPAGTAVTPDWSADQPRFAAIAPYARRLVDGTLIETRDLAVTIVASGLPRPPQTEDLVFLPDGDSRRVVAVTPQMIEGVPVSYTLQVR